MMNTSSLARFRRIAFDRRRLRSAVGDPLVHFLLIGVGIFVLAQAFAPRDDSMVMHVDDAVYGEIVDIFAAARGRAPSESEMAYLAERWLVDETLYREALSRRLDRGDSMIRERINQKMRILVQSSTVIGTPEESDLRNYFEENRDAYSTPALISFSIARIDGSEAEARDAAREMNADRNASGDRQILDFADRPRPSLVTVFGEDFVGGIESLPQGSWQPLDTQNGWQAVRVDRIEAGRDVSFDEIEDRVQADWQAREERERQNDALEALIANYEVIVEPYEPAAFEERAATAALSDPVVE